MTAFGRVAGWPGRILLVPSILVFLGIALQHVLHPVQAAAAQDISFVSPLGETVFRSGLGGFPLACALGLLFCLCSRGHVLIGLAFAELIVCTVLAVRVSGMVHDDTVGGSLHLVVAEMALASVTGLGIAAEVRRVRVQRKRPTLTAERV